MIFTGIQVWKLQSFYSDFHAAPTNDLYQPSLLEESQETCHACWSTCAAGCLCPSQKVLWSQVYWSGHQEPTQCQFLHPIQKKVNTEQHPHYFCINTREHSTQLQPLVVFKTGTFNLQCEETEGRTKIVLVTQQLITLLQLQIKVTQPHINT